MLNSQRVIPMVPMIPLPGLRCLRRPRVAGHVLPPGAAGAVAAGAGECGHGPGDAACVSRW